MLNSTTSLKYGFKKKHSFKKLADWQKEILFSLPQVASMYAFVLVPLGDREDGGISAADYIFA